MSSTPRPLRSTPMLDTLLLLWAAAVLVLNLPGHLSVDSLVQIAEGRTGVFRSWNPVFISTVFGKVTALTLDTGALVAASTALLGLGLRGLLGPALASQRSRWSRGAAYAVLALLLAAPILLIYPGIVWKDVWFAHLCLGGFAGLMASSGPAFGGRLQKGLAVMSAMALFAAAILSRQTAVLVVGLLLIGWALNGSPGSASAAPRWRRWVGGPLLILVWLMAFGAWVEAVTRERAGAPVLTGVRLVAAFDMAGILSRAPEASLQQFQALGLDTAPIEASARGSYSAQRVDTLIWPPVPGAEALSPGDHVRQWLTLAAQHPGAYLAHRWDVWAWQMGFREPARCLPVHVGIVEGALREAAQVDWTPSRRSSALYAYTLDWLSTPYYRAWCWFGVSLLVLAWAWREAGWRSPMVWLQGSALAYAASYAVVGIACDFRYVYYSVLVAQIGLVWLVLSLSNRQLLRKSRTRSVRGGQPINF